MLNNEKEYIMLRTEIENNLKRQETFFLITFTLLSVVNGVNENFWNYKILILLSILVFFIQIKILRTRTTVYYLLTYMIVFLEGENSNFKWETRLYKFRNTKYNNSPTKFFKKIGNCLNKIIENAASYLQHFINLSLVGFLYVKTIFMVLKENDEKICILYIIIATFVFMLNLIYTLKICFDKSLKERYLYIWNEIKKEELVVDLKHVRNTRGY